MLVLAASGILTDRQEQPPPPAVQPRPSHGADIPGGEEPI